MKLNRLTLAFTGTALAATALAPVNAQAAAPRPTVVLVHGAFADASSWAEVTRRLQRDGYRVVAPAVPLRGLDHDADYVAGVVRSLPGKVLLVGHSYGGAVITNVPARAPGKAVGLVYVAAFAPDAGESAGDLDTRYGGPSQQVTAPQPFPGAQPGPNDPPNVELTVKPELFHRYFAQDVPGRDAAVMAASQRPVALASLLQKSGDPAWKRLPSWYAVATGDRMIPPKGQWEMAKRAHARTVAVPGSHAVALSEPGPVARLVETAATTVKDAR